MMADACNPNNLWGGLSPGFQDQLEQHWEDLYLQKSQVQWCAPVVSATQEAEVERSLELRSLRLQ